MAPKSLSQPSASFALFLCRLSMGLYFLIAGIHKVTPDSTTTIFAKLSGFADFVAGSAPWLPEIVARSYGYALPFVEIIVGLLTIVGLASRWASAIMVLLLLSFIIGRTGLTDTPKPFHTNLIFLTLAILLWAIGPGRMSMDAAFGKRRRGV